MTKIMNCLNISWQSLFVLLVLLYGCEKSLDDDFQGFANPLYNLENELTHSYLLEADYDNDDYSYTFMNKYHSRTVNYRKDWPSPVHVTWSSLQSIDGELELQVKDNQNTIIKYTIPSENSSFDLYNLIPNKEYELSISAKDHPNIVEDVFPNRFKTTGVVRMISVDGLNVGNIRDIGGWDTKNGGKVVYGRLYRGGELSYTYPGATQIVISENGINTILNELKIDVEIDFGDVSMHSPISEYGVEFIHGDDYQIISYVDGLFDTVNRSKYANCIQIITERLVEGKVVFFHCNGGADRTGTLALIFEALLGVSEQDIAKDYELTCFSVLGNIRYRNQDSYRQLVNYIKSHYTGSDFNEKVYSMCVSSIEEGGFGINESIIKDFKAVLLNNMAL